MSMISIKDYYLPFSFSTFILCLSSKEWFDATFTTTVPQKILIIRKWKFCTSLKVWILHPGPKEVLEMSRLHWCQIKEEVLLVVLVASILQKVWLSEDSILWTRRWKLGTSGKIKKSLWTQIGIWSVFLQYQWHGGW